MNLLRITFIVFACMATTLNSHGETAKYLVQLRDKQNNTYNIAQPAQFLSAKAIARRLKFSIPIDSTDLPVSQPYIDSIKATGVEVITTSKWINTVSVQTNDPTKITAIAALSFVLSTEKTWSDQLLKSAHSKFNETYTAATNAPATNNYGASLAQIAMHQGDKMHELTYTGAQMLIAVLDVGFQNAPSTPSLQSLFNEGRVLGTRDFVNPGGDVFTNNTLYDHGTYVLSTMAGYAPGQLIGTAYDADYYLIRTEDNSSETPVEMDYWIAGAELADSVGADLINSSLGYFDFDVPFTDYTYADMDGQTIRISIAAGMAANKGMLVVNSSGNEGNNVFGKLLAPSDAIGVVGVGSVDPNGTYSSFSSRGPSADGRIKPNMAATGHLSYTQAPNGSYAYVDGTSFSSPTLCGLLAILWQALPNLSAQDIIQLAERHSSQFSTPDEFKGYGIPNILDAYRSVVPVQSKFTQKADLQVYPNPASTSFNVTSDQFISANASLTLHNLSGQKVMDINGTIHQRINIPTHLPKGIYILQVRDDGQLYKGLMSIE